MLARAFIGAAVIAGGVSALSLAAIPAEAHSIGRSATAFCKNPVEGRVGLAVQKSKARKRARRKWSYEVNRKHGYRWSFWEFAEARDYHCKKKAGTWRCAAHARPCDAQAR